MGTRRGDSSLADLPGCWMLNPISVLCDAGMGYRASWPVKGGVQWLIEDLNVDLLT